jgi:hypothetical protein
MGVSPVHAVLRRAEGGGQKYNAIVAGRPHVGGAGCCWYRLMTIIRGEGEKAFVEFCAAQDQPSKPSPTCL